ncbi:DUF3073 domain-containing protein [Mycolicibacterium grossiae]|uniref:DUF3073 domain-containing protein n=1 Tax=Mycolicibacterium grossiae TaxID=1552759 RepID=A0A1E8PWB5_9MYCO|nr:DUF3073 domain-containing protein [Mycolicibacterium grossiae]OFJ50387.1 hypothetical protein BEL07_28500 [Mycolicibacterium grossiae]QEM43713.1 DUF3073 domain-containing protein [Mycolicibacterium grossiae]
MGRGRAKAKQTKVARELKYSSPQTDFGQLQRELSNAPVDTNGRAFDDVDGDLTDRWADEDDWRR